MELQSTKKMLSSRKSQRQITLWMRRAAAVARCARTSLSCAHDARSQRPCQVLARRAASNERQPDPIRSHLRGQSRETTHQDKKQPALDHSRKAQDDQTSAATHALQNASFCAGSWNCVLETPPPTQLKIPSTELSKARFCKKETKSDSASTHLTPFAAINMIKHGQICVESSNWVCETLPPPQKMFPSTDSSKARFCKMKITIPLGECPPDPFHDH